MAWAVPPSGEKTMEVAVIGIGYRYATPVFNRDGTKVMCVQYPKAESWRNSVLEVPVNGGVSRNIGRKAVFSWLWDWSRDGAAVLLMGDLLDLPSLKTRQPIQVDPSENWGAARFSHDGRWMAFQIFPSTTFFTKPLRSNIFIAPFRGVPVTRKEWIPMGGGDSDYLPEFSSNDRLMFFASERDGFRCVWAQRLTLEMHPQGRPFAVYHSHERRRPLAPWSGADVEMAAGPHAIIFSQKALAGNVWLMESLVGELGNQH